MLSEPVSVRDFRSPTGGSCIALPEAVTYVDQLLHSIGSTQSMVYHSLTVYWPLFKLSHQRFVHCRKISPAEALTVSRKSRHGH